MHKYCFAAILFLLTSIQLFGQNGDYRVKTITGTTAGYRNGPDSVALFNSPTGIATDNAGNLYVADTYNNVIRKISITDSVTTLAGNNSAGLMNGSASIAEFNQPQGVCVDRSGNVYIADTYNNVIRKISAGMVTTFAGSGQIGFKDGQADSAQFYLPTGVAVDTFGNVYVADNGNFSVREISKSGTVTTIAGNGQAGFKNGAVDTSYFGGLYGIAVNQSGTNIYVTEYINNDVRLIQNGVVSVLAGYDTVPSPAAYLNGYSINDALFNSPTGITTDNAGNVFLSDEYNNVIREVKNGYVITAAGNDSAGFRDSLDYLSEFNQPYGITMNKGSFYVVDNANNRIRKMTPTHPLGIQPVVQDETNMLVYPIPCDDQLIIASRLSGNAEILDVTGRQVWNSTQFKAPCIISTQSLSPGVYFLRVSDNTGTATRKIVIAR